MSFKELKSSEIKELRNKILKEQGYVCPLCGKTITEKDKITLDHQHKIRKTDENGVNGMTLYDLIEMWADWNAAVKRNKDGDIRKSVEINGKRFKLNERMARLLMLRLQSLSRQAGVRIFQPSMLTGSFID